MSAASDAVTFLVFGRDGYIISRLQRCGGFALFLPGAKQAEFDDVNGRMSPADRAGR
jgi:hypothetical protein